MSWAYFKEYDRWTQANNEERIIVKRQVAQARCICAFGIFANAAAYLAFMTGIYNYRTKEILNMRKVPFVVKFGLSSLVAYTMSLKLYENYVYEPEIYRVAIKYRVQFDKDYQKIIQDNEPLF